MPMPRSSSKRGREGRESLSMWSALLSIPLSHADPRSCISSTHNTISWKKDKVEFCEGLMEIGEESFGVGAIIPYF